MALLIFSTWILRSIEDEVLVVNFTLVAVVLGQFDDEEVSNLFMSIFGILSKAVNAIIIRKIKF